MTFLWWIVFSILVGILGKDRNCGFFLAFILSLILSPIIGVIITLLSKRKKSKFEYLAEIKMLLDAGAINQLEYSKMVEDIMSTGKCKDPDHYRHNSSNPFKRLY